MTVKLGADVRVEDLFRQTTPFATLPTAFAVLASADISSSSTTDVTDVYYDRVRRGYLKNCEGIRWIAMI